MATKVTLRQKKISKDRKSLYLDFYPAIKHPDTGKPTRREFLGLYIYEKAKTPVDKQANKDTMQLAENIKAQRQLDIQNSEYGFLSGKKKKADFVQYFTSLAEKRTGSNANNWTSALNYLNDFTNGSWLFSDLNEHTCIEFREYLQTAKTKRSKDRQLSTNAALSYFSKFKTALKKAYKDGYLDTDLSSKVAGVKPEETQREYLSNEELNKLAKTECTIPVLKIAALFSALTGLRFSDIAKLTWKEVNHNKEIGYYLQFRQQKTKGTETLPISEQAHSLLGERKEPESQVFEGLKYSAYVNAHLIKWCAKAGITKHITFHSFRHTYATLQLSSGTDIYTVQKLLGHRNSKTTQVYLNLVDQKKKEAANKIKLDL